jgi:heme exporter protein C
MKALLLSAGFIIGIAWGVFPGISKPKSTFAKLFALVVMTLTIILSLWPQTAGSPEDAVLVSRMGAAKFIPVLCTIDISHAMRTDAPGEWIIPLRGSSMKSFLIRYTSPTMDDIDKNIFGDNNQVIALLKRGSNDGEFFINGIVAINPILTLPYIVGLEERARILYFHVPMSWIAFLAYIIAMIYSVKYLRNPDQYYDSIASSAASLGTIFCVLATITGAIWAKFNWGSFWNWDPREISIFVLLLIYSAYFVLRSAIENEETRARLSSVYAILGAVAAVFFIYVAPRIYGGLHPGSADDSSSGPVLSQQDGTLNVLKQIILSLSFASFTIIFYWLLNLSVRIKFAKKALFYSNNS